MEMSGKNHRLSFTFIILMKKKSLTFTLCVVPWKKQIVRAKHLTRVHQTQTKMLENVSFTVFEVLKFRGQNNTSVIYN